MAQYDPHTVSMSESSSLDWGGEDERTEEADKVQRFAFSLRVDSFNKCLGLINERKIAFTKHIQATTNIN